MRVACLCPTDFFPYGEIVRDRVADELPEDMEMESFAVHEDEFPEGFGYDAVVVSGSEYHVYDRQPWVEQSKIFVREALLREVPCLGICYGHQLIADVLGGTVQPMDGREMGYRTIERVEDDGLFEGVPEEFVSFTSHLDHVAVPPDDATVLARNDRGIQAFRSGVLPAYGIQFHPEYDLEMARRLLSSKDLSGEERETIAATLTVENEEKAEVSRRVLVNFFDGV